MYTLSSPPCLPWGPLRTRNPTPTPRALSAQNTSHSGTILAPITESEHVLKSPSSAASDAFVPSPIDSLIARPACHPRDGANLDPSLRSTWSHRAWAAAGTAAVITALVNSVAAAVNSGTIVEPAAAAILGYVLADLGTGFYHFAIDNYGSPSTPIFGSQIEAFQGHHRRPSTITRRQPANNLHSLSRAVAFVVVPLELAAGGGDGGPAAAAASIHAFIGVCAGCVMLSQQFHAWAHGVKGKVPRWVDFLQGAGVLISRDMHGAHHRVPYNNNYCIVSGLWNKALDELRVFEIVEMVVFFRFGVRPRSWGETSTDWREVEENVERL